MKSASARAFGKGLAALVLGATLLIPPAFAGEITVAAATNFAEPLQALTARFERETGHRVIVSNGSSGQLYAQIVNGAPFDVFLSADDSRPARLEAEGRAVAGSRFTYALGRLALWVPAGKGESGKQWLRRGGFRHLAIANPRLAPYGLAARQALAALGLWDTLQSRVVLGENIGQAYSLVATGNAEGGLLALAQLRRPGQEAPGILWQLPDDLHEPIRQQAVLVKECAAARAFLDFLRSPAARELIASFGYGVEDA